MSTSKNRWVVNSWIKEVKAQGIRSLIVLLDDRQLRLYEELHAGLIPYYRAKKLNVVHVNAPNWQRPALSDEHLKKVWAAYQRLPIIREEPLKTTRGRHFRFAQQTSTGLRSAS